MPLRYYTNNDRFTASYLSNQTKPVCIRPVDYIAVQNLQWVNRMRNIFGHLGCGFYRETNSISWVQQRTHKHILENIALHL